MNFLRFCFHQLGTARFAVMIGLIVLFIGGELAVATVWGWPAAVAHAVAVITCNIILQDDGNRR